MGLMVRSQADNSTAAPESHPKRRLDDSLESGNPQMLGTPSRAPSSEKTLHIREQPSRAKSPAFTLCYGLQLCQTADASGMETFGIMAVEVLNVDLPRLRRNVVYGLLFSVRAVWTLSHGASSATGHCRSVQGPRATGSSASSEVLRSGLPWIDCRLP